MSQDRDAAIELRVDGDVTGTVLVLAHGAGAGKDHPFMTSVAAQIATAGIGVVRFDFPYVAQGRKAPDRMPVLEGTFEAVVDQVRATAPTARLYLGGKSMGARVAAHLAARRDDVEGLVFLGYPLHPPGRPDRLRDAPLRAAPAPMLFVTGTRDPFCPLDTLREVLRGVRAATVTVIEDGDHSFKVRRSSGRGNEEALAEAARAVVVWLQR